MSNELSQRCWECGSADPLNCRCARDAALTASPQAAPEGEYDWEAAHEALESLDDFARMDVGVAPHGPYAVLRDLLTKAKGWQQAALASPQVQGGVKLPPRSTAPGCTCKEVYEQRKERIRALVEGVQNTDAFSLEANYEAFVTNRKPMTDIERLRELLALEDMLCAQEGGPTHEDCVRFDYECACFISVHGKSLLADYERLRGMEERVKGAVPTTWLDPLLSGPNAVLPEGGVYNGKHIERLLTAINKRLVPVPGGEGK
jgi:hypothetical protein